MSEEDIERDKIETEKAQKKSAQRQVRILAVDQTPRLSSPSCLPTRATPLQRARNLAPRRTSITTSGQARGGSRAKRREGSTKNTSEDSPERSHVPGAIDRTRTRRTILVDLSLTTMRSRRFGRAKRNLLTRMSKEKRRPRSNTSRILVNGLLHLTQSQRMPQ